MDSDEKAQKVFAHVRDRVMERYGINLDWSGFEAMNKQATEASLRLNHQARIPWTELRFFYYLGFPFLVFYDLNEKRIGSVLPYHDLRWRHVPVEHRPAECFERIPEKWKRS